VPGGGLTVATATTGLSGPAPGSASAPTLGVARGPSADALVAGVSVDQFFALWADAPDDSGLRLEISRSLS
jgi:hypothetical protein